MQEKKTPQLVKGTRDFNALQIVERDYILSTIRQIYQQYGFSPLETPALEYLSTLLDQYGHEGEQLIFKILNSGDFLMDTTPELLKKNSKDILHKIVEKGLRYDLTVPLMRYVAMNNQELVFPFKRYQIQQVWRADRPQKGRYKEFYQCDADVIGTTSLICEAEILVMVCEILQKLNIPSFKIHLNHRGILNGIVTLIDEREKMSEFCMVIDKLDKIGKERVKHELEMKGFSSAAINKIDFIFNLQGDNNEIIKLLEEKFISNEKGIASLNEIKKILAYIALLREAEIPIIIEPSLARGLTYYTGAIFEIRISSIGIGSLVGGGRYDDFGKKFDVLGLTGVGCSFGIDRLHLVMSQLSLFPETLTAYTIKVMFTNLDMESETIALKIISQLRKKNILVELYPEQSRLKKQLTYANKKNIPFVVVIGEEEKRNKKFIFKNMKTGEQAYYGIDDLIDFLGELK